MNAAPALPSHLRAAWSVPGGSEAWWAAALLVGLALGWVLRRARGPVAAGRSWPGPAERPGAAPPPPERNPGPGWSYALTGFCARWMPRWFNRWGVDVGSALCLGLLWRQRRCSRAYLRLALGREPSWGDQWRHFRAFGDYLLLRLAIARGQPPRLRLAPGQDDAAFRALAASGQPALYGTMHVGHSDLLGYFLGDLGARVHMVRKRVGNSRDTERLARRYAHAVSYLWVNRWSERVWAMNEALRAGGSLAMQCDRAEHSAKLEPCRFFGQWRRWPFTIYHLALMHNLPVAFAFALPDPADPMVSVLSVPDIFWPDPALGRAENLARARAHFQGVLDLVERRLVQTPWVWFNFTPLNPPAPVPVKLASPVTLGAGVGAEPRSLRPSAGPAGTPGGGSRGGQRTAKIRIRAKMT